MAKMTKFSILCLIVVFACYMQFLTAAPMINNRPANDMMDEIIVKLKQLQQQSEGKN